MKAYVLAAGYATRMYPLTENDPKALLEVGGRAILSYIMDELRRLEGLTDVVIVTNDRFHDRFESWVSEQEPWVRFTVVNDGTTSNDDRLGALGDLRLAIDTVPLEDSHALVLASDHLFDIDLEDVHRAFLEHGRTTLLVRTVELSGGPSPYSEVTVDDDGRVLRFREKPADPRTDLSAIALYFFPASDLAMLDEYLAQGDHDAPGHFLAWLVERVPVYARPLESRWYDIGSLDSFAEAKRRFEGSDPFGDVAG
jgi:glucose-1-phosphate thymidylyltransferase